MILAALYLLWMYQRFVFGQPNGAKAHASHGHEHAIETRDTAHKISDLSWRELVAVVPIVIFMFWIGLQPMNFLKTSERTMYQMSDDLLKMKQSGVAMKSVEPNQHVILSRVPFGLRPTPGGRTESKDLLASLRTKDSSTSQISSVWPTMRASLRFATLRMTSKEKLGVRE